MSEAVQPIGGPDRELWREKIGDFYSDSIHVTSSGDIGINCGGMVIVAPLKQWHLALNELSQLRQERDALRECVECLLIGRATNGYLSPHWQAEMNRILENPLVQSPRLKGTATRSAGYD